MRIQIPEKMKAMVFESVGNPLILMDVPVPSIEPLKVLVEVLACGICRTDLHIIDGELTEPKFPLILGHEIIGRVAEIGDEVTTLKIGDLVGVPWLGYTCGKCKYCKRGQENLCDFARFTGYTIDGGYAEYTLVNERFCFLMDELFDNPIYAPLLCAGLIGYRAYHMIPKSAENIGFYGFGAAANLLTQLAVFEEKKVYAFTNKEDFRKQKNALLLGAEWSGDSTQSSPVKLDASIIFAPVGELIPQVLKNTDKGGIVICGGIHMSDIPSFPYPILWEERSIKSVANLTRFDGEEFLKLAKEIPIRAQVELFPLEEANKAIQSFKTGMLKGNSAVLVINNYPINPLNSQ
jgi:propanol-preferring alcohol dehydrogenase